MLSRHKALDIAVATLDQGGATYHIANDYQPTEGYAVAKYRQYGEFVEHAAFNEASLLDFVQERLSVFEEDPSAFLGTWDNKEGYTNEAGTYFAPGVYLDISMVVFDEEVARQQCQELNEASYFDFSVMEDVMVA